MISNLLISAINNFKYPSFSPPLLISPFSSKPFMLRSSWDFIILVHYDMSINASVHSTADGSGYVLYQKHDAEFQQWISDYSLEYIVPNVLDVPCPANEVYDECATDCYESCQSLYEQDSS